MSLLTPSERFDPFYSFKLLQVFPQEISNSVLEALHKSNTLIRSPQHDRTVPGTRYALSAKFMIRLSSSYPEGIYAQAREYENF